MAATAPSAATSKRQINKQEYDLFAGPSSTITINGLLHHRINVASALTQRPNKKTIKELVEELLWEKYGPKPEVQD